jgi:DNA polymerase-3 subunit delta'
VSPLAPPPIHTRAQRRVQAVLAQGRWAPAYLVAGSAGSGVGATATYLANAVLCTEADPPCGDCLPCRKVSHDNHPAFTHTGSPAETVKIETAREVIARLALQPYEGERQVVVLDGADRLHPAAGNALLKTLEEPPGRAVLILTARHLTAVLPTIRSRCQILRLPVPEVDLLQAQGELTGLAPAEARLRARIAAAQPGDAAALSTDEVVDRIADCFTLWERLLDGRGGPLLAWLEDFLKGTEKSELAGRLTAWLTTFGLWLRDAMLVSWDCSPERLTFVEVRERLGATPLPDRRFFEGAVARLAAAHAGLAANGQPRLVIGALLLGLQDDLARWAGSRYHCPSAGHSGRGRTETTWLTW